LCFAQCSRTNLAICDFVRRRKQQQHSPFSMCVCVCVDTRIELSILEGTEKREREIGLISIDHVDCNI
jgi:hypothetical protein